VLVTGGFGFLGGHVLERLLAEPGTHVHVVDNLSSNPISVERLLADLGTPANLTYDITTVEDYISADPAAFDEVVHLASPVGPAGVLKHGGRIVSSVVGDTYLLADYCLASRARLLDVSTSEVYGGGRDGLCSEDDPKIVPAEPSFRLEYAVGKLAAETALINLHARSGLDVVIVRPFNIAGPRQSGEGGFVLPRFLCQARFGLPLTIFGDGSARRAFSHVGDLADGVILALRRGEPGVAYNLGNPDNRVTVGGLADLVLEVTASHSAKAYIDPTTIYGPFFKEANDKFPAAGRAILELGWAPSRSVAEVVSDSWDYIEGCDAGTVSRIAGSQVVDALVAASTDRARASRG
jgi:nucleoside-diphosphate-sugar epimerase